MFLDDSNGAGRHPHRGAAKSQASEHPERVGAEATGSCPDVGDHVGKASTAAENSRCFQFLGRERLSPRAAALVDTFHSDGRGWSRV